MADYPFRVNIMPKNGEGTVAFYTSSLADDGAGDAVLTAAEMVEKINLMPSASYEDGVVSGSSTSFNFKFGGARNRHLSCSVTHATTGSIIFQDKETSTDAGLDFYTFWGTKVCSVLGLPEGIPIYTENFKLSDDSANPGNYLSGDIIADGVSIKQNFKLSPQSRVKSNLVWDQENGEGFLQWVSGSFSRLLMGYDPVNDVYKIEGAATAGGIATTFNISGVDNLTATVGSFSSLTANQISNGSADFDILAGRSSFDQTVLNKGQLQIDTGASNKMQGRFAIRYSETTSATPTTALTTSDFGIGIFNRHGNSTGDFAGICFDAATEEDSDAIGGAIAVARDNATAENHASNMLFMTNPTSDDDLAERMRITHDGLVGIGESNPDSTLEVNGDVHVINDLTVDDNLVVDGIITAPAQPCFHAHAATAQTNGASSTTTTVVFGTERTDAGSNFASNTFTAPVAGTYFLQTTLDVRSIPSTADYFWAKIITSNETYYGDIIRIDDIANDTVAYFTYSCTVIADMDASDTAYVGLQSANAGTSWTIHGVGGQPHSFFQGHLIG